MVLPGVKSRVLDRLKPYTGKWARELPFVLWALRTSPSRATSESPFFLTYGSEVVLPTELEFGSLRIQNFNERQSEGSRLEDLDRQLVDYITSTSLFYLSSYFISFIFMNKDNCLFNFEWFLDSLFTW